MPVIRSCVIAVATVLHAGIAGAQDAAAPPPEVKTAATAERSVPADLARITLTFSREGRSRADAGARLAAKMDSVRRALEALGVSRDSMFTGSTWYWWSGRIEVREGNEHLVPGPNDPPYRPTLRVRDSVFKSTDAVEVHIHNIKLVGAVVDVALAQGAGNISPIRFSARNLAAAQDAALREATQSARRQAQAIAEAGGSQLGPVLGFSTAAGEERYGYRGLELSSVVTASDGSSYGGGDRGPGTEIAAPAIPVRVTVYGRWSLVSRP